MLTSFFFLTVNCTSDLDCTLENTDCKTHVGYCDCKAGYSEINGKCSQSIHISPAFHINIYFNVSMAFVLSV